MYLLVRTFALLITGLISAVAHLVIGGTAMLARDDRVARARRASAPPQPPMAFGTKVCVAIFFGSAVLLFGGVAIYTALR